MSLMKEAALLGRSEPLGAAWGLLEPPKTLFAPCVRNIHPLLGQASRMLGAGTNVATFDAGKTSSVCKAASWTCCEVPLPARWEAGVCNQDAWSPVLLDVVC